MPGEPRRDPTSSRRGGNSSRQRILDAALAEFAGKGYAGARVRAVARRAGVNTQLISYYFGGKEGLYNELLASWRQQEARIERKNTSFADNVEGYQAAGEIAADIDPAYLLIAVMGAHTTIVTMPEMIERLCGLRADSEEFVSAYASQLRLIIGHLAGPHPAGTARAGRARPPTTRQPPNPAQNTQPEPA